MASVTTTTDPRLARPAAAGISSWLKSLGDAWARYTVYNRTIEELSALSTRDLDDLGIARSDIRRLAHETAYGVQ